jgi:hypothetical protein
MATKAQDGPRQHRATNQPPSDLQRPRVKPSTTSPVTKLSSKSDGQKAPPRRKIEAEANNETITHQVAGIGDNRQFEERDNIVALFRDKVSARGSLHGTDDVCQMLSETLSDFPEIEAGPAVRELRDQCRSLSHPRDWSKEVPFDRDVHGDPITYLFDRYGEAIATGELGPGQLSLINKPLVNAVNYDLRKAGEGKTLGDLIEEHRPADKQGSPSQRRFMAIARILETSIENAARLLGGVRFAPERPSHRALMGR